MANPGIVLALFLLCLGQLVPGSHISSTSQPGRGALPQHFLMMEVKEPLPGEIGATRRSVPANSNCTSTGEKWEKPPLPSLSSSPTNELLLVFSLPDLLLVFSLPDLLLLFSAQGQEKEDVQVSLAGDSRLPSTEMQLFP